MEDNSAETTESMESVFEDSFDSFESFMQRKKAGADAERYRALYYVYTRRENRVREEEIPCDDLQPLYDSNLLARVPHPDGGATVRITTLGKDEIESDLRAVRGSSQKSEENS